MLLALPKGDFHREGEDIQNGWYKVLFEERVQYYDTRSMKAYTPFKRPNYTFRRWYKSEQQRWVQSNGS